MNADSKAHVVTFESPRPASAEQRLKKVDINLPVPPQPFGTYVEAVRTGKLLFLSGMLPTEGHEAKFVWTRGRGTGCGGGAQGSSACDAQRSRRREEAFGFAG